MTLLPCISYGSRGHHFCGQLYKKSMTNGRRRFHGTKISVIKEGGDDFEKSCAEVYVKNIKNIVKN